MFVSVVCCHKKNVTASVRHKTQQHIDLGTARARFIYAIIFAQYALAVSQWFCQQIWHFCLLEEKSCTISASDSFYLMNPNSAAPVCVFLEHVI